MNMSNNQFRPFWYSRWWNQGFPISSKFDVLPWSQATVLSWRFFCIGCCDEGGDLPMKHGNGRPSKVLDSQTNSSFQPLPSTRFTLILLPPHPTASPWHQSLYILGANKNHSTYHVEGHLGDGLNTTLFGWAHDQRRFWECGWPAD